MTSTKFAFEGKRNFLNVFVNNYEFVANSCLQKNICSLEFVVVVRLFELSGAF